MIKIVRDFFRDPDSIRKMAIESKYCLISAGNFIGRDSVDMDIMNNEIQKRIKELFPGNNFKVIRSRFRTAIEGDTHLTFVHADAAGTDQGWHILVYLTKDSEFEDGLVFYDHVDNGKICNDYTKEYTILDTVRFDRFRPWKIQKYEYNTAVVVDYAYFHSPMNNTGFGDCVENSRLMLIIEVVDVNSATYKDRIAFEGVRESLYK